MRSRMKWLANAKGIAKNGLTTLVAIAAPTTTCGVSSIFRTDLDFLYDILVELTMSILPVVISAVLGALTFQFLLWKRLGEDYPPNIIFSVGFYVVGCLVAGAALFNFALSPILHKSYFFNPSGLWFWGALIGSMVGFGLAIFKFKIRFFETLEALTIGGLFWILYLLISQAALIQAVVVLVLIILFFIFGKRYKTFAWYKSGKVGFAGLAILAIFFMLRAIAAIIYPDIISFIGKIDAIVSASLAFIFFLTVYNLGERYE